MSILENKEKLMSLTAAVFEVTNTKPSIQSLNRWCHRGITARRGEDRVKLEFVLVGQRMMTSVEAVRRFLDRSTSGRQAEPPELEPEVIDPKKKKLRADGEHVNRALAAHFGVASNG